MAATPRSRLRTEVLCALLSCLVHVHYSTATEDAGHYHMSHNADDPPLDTATLKQQMAAHKFLFVAGPHHSGTTLMSLLVGRNSHTAGLVNTSVPQGEGQHLQSMYPKAYNLGGMTRYAFNPDSRITETSALATEETAVKLFAAWSPFWNLKRDTLVEKTPNHLVMTRFLQKLFTPERTQFVITLRHPLGATNFKWKLPKQLQRFRDDCGYALVKHWLAQMDILREDIVHLNKATIVMFEFFTANGKAQRNYEHLMDALGLPSEINITVAPRKSRYPLEVMQKLHELSRLRKKYRRLKDRGGGDAGDASRSNDENGDTFRSSIKRVKRRRQLFAYEGGEEGKGEGMANTDIDHGIAAHQPAYDTAQQRQRRRRLLGYQGHAMPADALQLQLHEEKWMSWTEAWEERIQNHEQDAACKQMFADLEERVNFYGYSLVNPAKVTIPEPFKKYVVVPLPEDIQDHV